MPQRKRPTVLVKETGDDDANSLLHRTENCAKVIGVRCHRLPVGFAVRHVRQLPPNSVAPCQFDYLADEIFKFLLGRFHRPILFVCRRFSWIAMQLDWLACYWKPRLRYF